MENLTNHENEITRLKRHAHRICPAPTPGPWEIEEERLVYRPARCAGWPTFGRIIAARLDETWPQGPERQANLRLIVAAVLPEEPKPCQVRFCPPGLELDQAAQGFGRKPAGGVVERKRHPPPVGVAVAAMAATKRIQPSSSKQ